MRKKGIIKAVLSAAILTSAVTILSSCGGTALADDDAVLEYAQEYFANTTLSIECDLYRGNERLVWFVGDRDVAERYEAVSFRVDPNVGYRVARIESPDREAAMIRSCWWQGGKAFIVDNPACTKITVNNSGSSYDINISETPACFFCDLGSDGTVSFYGSNGRELL